ncbi:MAG: DUF2892 domain-containing protein [Deltaproteobacteria bacterium]|nr:DUF2892 domain-containing protein [Deltaproteobacteria bacterium]
MTVNDTIRLIAGAFVVVSVALGVLWTPWALAFTAFVGVNLMQSAFTKTCPMISLLRKLGVPETVAR